VIQRLPTKIVIPTSVTCKLYSQTNSLWFAVFQINLINFNFISCIIQNITQIKVILDITHCPVFYLKHSLPETGICLRLTKILDTIHHYHHQQHNTRWIMSIIVIDILIYHRHNPIDSINLLDLYRRRVMFPVRYRRNYRSYL
jgi:hypothetical protein